MKSYETPKVIENQDTSEGIYMSSGNGGVVVDVDDTTDTTDSTVSRGCKSIYMQGVFQMPTYQPITDGYKIGRGCEGCPAWNGNSCRFQSAPEQMNWDGDFRPSWEVAGHLPDEKGY